MKGFFSLKRVRIFLYLILALGLVGCFSLSYAGLEHNVSGWAWSSTIGWISFNSINCDADGNGLSDGTLYCPPAGTVIIDYGVDVTPNIGDLTGYAWTSNIGWIKFDPAGDFDTGFYPEDPQQPAKLDLGTNQFSGWARACAGTVNKDCNSSTRTDGWDGWIKMAGTALDGNFYSVKKEAKSYNVKGFAWDSENVGWIKFRGTAQDGSPYGVIAAFTPPEILSTSVTYYYCEGDSRAVTLNWVYYDDDGDPQVSYQVQIDTDASFSPPLVLDTGEVSSSSGSYTPPDPTIFGWNKTYQWRVKVKDQPGWWSAWEKDNFKTPKHQYPAPGFSWSPLYPNAYDPDYPDAPDTAVQFTDESKCYDDSGNVVPCASWSWTFQDGDPANSSETNPTVKFLAEGDKTVTLEVCDSEAPSYCCPEEKSIYVNFPLPEWKERIPR